MRSKGPLEFFLMYGTSDTLELGEVVVIDAANTACGFRAEDYIFIIFTYLFFRDFDF